MRNMPKGLPIIIYNVMGKFFKRTKHCQPLKAFLIKGLAMFCLFHLTPNIVQS